MGELSRTLWSRIRGNNVVFKKDKECWQWQASGQCSKGDICSNRHDKNKRAKPTEQPAPSPEPSTPLDGEKSSESKEVPEAENHLGEYFACRARIILRVLARIHLVKSGIPQSARSTRKKELHIRGKVLVRTSQVEEQPSQRSKRNGDKSAVALLKRDKELGLCISGRGAAKIVIDFTEELNHAETNPTCSIHQSSVFRSQRKRPQSIAQQNLPRGSSSAQPQRSKIGDRSQEETEWQEHWAREAAWKLAKKILKLKEKHKNYIFSLTEKWCLPSVGTNAHNCHTSRCQCYTVN